MTALPSLEFPADVDGVLDMLVLWARTYRDARRDSAKAAAKRGALPYGSTRARVTTANADWARKAEARDIAQERLAEVVAECQRRGVLPRAVEEAGGNRCEVPSCARDTESATVDPCPGDGGGSLGGAA